MLLPIFSVGFRSKAVQRSNRGEPLKRRDGYRNALRFRSLCRTGIVEGIALVGWHSSRLTEKLGRLYSADGAGISSYCPSFDGSSSDSSLPSKENRLHGSQSMLESHLPDNQASASPVLPEFIGESVGITNLRAEVAYLLARQGHGRRLPTLLLQGETGTGKGLLA